MIERGVFDEPAPGVLVVGGSADTFNRRAYATSLVCGSGAIGGLAGGWLHRLDGVNRPATIELKVLRGQRPNVGSLPATIGFTRAAFEDDVIELRSIRTLSLARSIVDLAGSAGGPPIERLVDDFERRGESLSWLEQTATRLHRRGRPGPPEILRDIQRRRERRDRSARVRGSWFQKLVAECLRSSRIPELVEEYEIRDEAGRLAARCDLAIPIVRLGIEAHSRRFHDHTSAEAYDERRDNRVAELGWDLRYVGWADTKRPAEFRRYIERLVARRASDLGIVLPIGAVRTGARRA